jgi:predicted TIM-barrel fold metal-dependent hydrolase
MTAVDTLAPPSAKAQAEGLLAQIGTRLMDCDNHYYEPRDCFTRHMDPALARHNFRWMTNADGAGRLLVRDRMVRVLNEPTFDKVPRPGAVLQVFKDGNGADYAMGSSQRYPVEAAYQNRDARVARLDEQQVAKACLYPTLGNLVEELIKDDAPLTVATLRAFNRWLEEDWGFAYEDRLYAAALMTLADREAAIEELEWALKQGARVIHLRSAPVPTSNGPKSPADSYFDPFWARVNEAGVLVACHAGDNGCYSEAAKWGEPRNPNALMMANFTVATYSFRGVFELLASMTLSGLFERFPRLRVAALEQGSNWAPFLIERLKHVRKRRDRFRLKGDPVDYFLQHVYISPHPEEDIRRLADAIGADHVIMGSDYPHPEGTTEPMTLLNEVEGFSVPELRKLFVENTAGLLEPPR